jgi:hypothetical protein
MMASHNSPGTKTRRRQLPSLSVEVADKQKFPFTSHMTYKSSLEYFMKNEGIFAKALELIKRYPTLSDHHSTAKIWEILSLGNTSYQGRPRSHYDRQQVRPKTPIMPTISLTPDRTSAPQCSESARNEKLHLGILGMPPEHSDSLKWPLFVCSLSSEVFVHCFKFNNSTNVALEMENVDGILFIMSTSSLHNAQYLQAINFAHEHCIPVVFIREPGFKLPQQVSGEFTEKVLLQQGIQQQQSSSNSFSDSNSLQSDALPPISKSGYYINPGPKKNSSFSRSISPGCLVSSFQDALLFSGNNVDYCVQATLKLISQFLRTRDNMVPTMGNIDEDSSKLNPPRFDNFLTSTPNSRRQTFAQGGLFADAVSDSSSSTESSEDSVVEVSPAKNTMQRSDSLDQETIYVLFPDRSEGSSSRKPVLVKWPLRENESHIRDTSLTDLDDISILSDSSIGFQDVDLEDTMSTSDEDFILT